MKLNIQDLKNITPVGKEISLKYEEGYNGKENEIKIRIYPLTVSEKIELQTDSDKLNKLLKIKERTDDEDKEVIRLNDKINLDYAYFTTKKVIDGITREYITENFPKVWFTQIFQATLEAEGINLKDIEKEKN